MTTLIGRDASVAAAAALLRRDDVRILTITGPGGIGKTRLAQAVAIETADRFADGVVLVPLQSIRDSGHVIGTIARSLGLFDGEISSNDSCHISKVVGFSSSSTTSSRSWMQPRRLPPWSPRARI